MSEGKKGAIMTVRFSLTTWLLALVLIATIACSSTIHREFSVDREPATSLSIDARQRVIVVTNKGGEGGNRHVVCAEPSPDVFTALGVTAAAEAKVGEEGGRLAAALVEDATALGPRTQVIQLLRDALYRACEAYMNGVIDKDGYRRILLAFDEMVITLLAIDGLTHGTELPQNLVRRETAVSFSDNGDTSGSVSAGTHPYSDVEFCSGDPKLAAEIHEILKSYYKFQLEIKNLYMQRRSEENIE